MLFLGIITKILETLSMLTAVDINGVCFSAEGYNMDKSGVCV